MYKNGIILQDREECSEVIAVRVDSRRSDEVVVHPRDPAQNRYSDQTVYDFNSRYEYVSAEDPVVHAVYLDSIRTDIADLTRQERAVLARDADVQTYAFPISRLVPPDDP